MDGPEARRARSGAPVAVIRITAVHALALFVLLALSLGGAWLILQRARPASPAQPSLAPGAPVVPAQGSPGNELAGPKQGEPAPDFTLNDLDGKPLRLSSLRGKPVLINFWATWCAPCRAEMPDIVKAYNRYKDNDFVVLSVNIKDDFGPEAVKKFIADYKMTFPVVRDALGEVEQTYRLRGYPTSVFVDRTGKITAVVAGPVTGGTLEARLKEIL